MKSKEQKRKEAIKRQELYNKLTTKQKIDKLDRSGFRAVKQRSKLSRDRNVDS